MGTATRTVQTPTPRWLLANPWWCGDARVCLVRDPGPDALPDMGEEALDLLRLHGGCASVFDLRLVMDRIAGMDPEAVNELLTDLLRIRASGLALHYGPHRGAAA